MPFSVYLLAFSAYVVFNVSIFDPQNHPDPEPDSLEMLDPYLINPHPQNSFHEDRIKIQLLMKCLKPCLRIRSKVKALTLSGPPFLAFTQRYTVNEYF